MNKLLVQLDMCMHAYEQGSRSVTFIDPSCVSHNEAEILWVAYHIAEM